MTDYSAYLSATPPDAAATDDLAYNLGIEFLVTSQSWFKGGKFWQPSINSPSSSLRTASLWRQDSASTGTKLWEKQFNVVVSGWNTVLHENPPELDINQRYKFVVLHPNGRYPATANYYSSGDGSSNLVNGPLTVVSAANSTIVGDNGGQNTYVQNAAVSFPISQSNSANYWNDVIISDTNPGVGVMTSISDEARVNMLAQLGLVEPQNKSNTDLMREVLLFPGQTLISIVDGASAATHYCRYLIQLRNS